MNELEQYLFDLQGFLVIDNVLTEADIAVLNELLDQTMTLEDALQYHHFRFDGVLALGAPFQSLIEHAKIVPYLECLMGANYRLDHNYAHIIRQGTGPIGAFLHGGGAPFDPCQYYLFKDGKMHNGLTAVAYQLTDMSSDEGGFGCVPGSHKCNFPLPAHWVDLETPRHPALKAIAAKAGSAIVFTEALSHGTLPWTGDRERRTLFYKYSPYPSAWSRHYPIAAQFPHLTESQRQRLRTPGVSPHSSMTQSD